MEKELLNFFQEIKIGELWKYPSALSQKFRTK